MCRPDLMYELFKCAQVQNTKENYAKYLNNALEQLKKTKNRVLTYHQLYKAKSKLVVFSDAHFASNEDRTSQLGYVITLTDIHKKSNILQYSSTKYRRGTRSVLAAEIFATKNSFEA